MPRGSYLTDVEKGKILAWKQDNLSNREIARKIDRTHVVVANFLKNPDEYGSRKTGGPKKKLKSRQIRAIVNLGSNASIDLATIKEKLHLDVSKSTISRTIKTSTSLRHSKLLKAPKLSDHHKAFRCEFAYENMDRNWSKVQLF